MNGIDLTKWKSWHVDAAGALLCVAMFALVYFAGIGPLLSRRAAYETLRNDLDLERREVVKAASSLDDLQEQISSATRDLAESRIHLQSADRINRRIAELTDLVMESGLKIDIIEPGGVIKRTWYNTVAIRLEGSGECRKSMLFLHELREMFPDMVVSSLRLSAGPPPATSQGSFRLDVLWCTAPHVVAAR